MAPVNIDGTDIVDATIDGTSVRQITVDGDVVFETGPAAGTQMVVTDRTVGDVFMFSLTTPFDISTATQDTSFQPGGDLRAVHINKGGTFLHIGTSANETQQYNLSTAFDLTTATFDTQFSLSGSISGLDVANSGSRIYVTNQETSEVSQFDLSTPFDIDTRSLVSTESFSLSGFPVDVEVVDGGSRFYIVSTVGISEFTQFDLSTPFDISTRTQVNQVSLSPGNDQRGLSFKEDGSVLITTDRDSDVLREYQLSTPYDITTASEVDNIPSPTSDNIGVDLN